MKKQSLICLIFVLCHAVQLHAQESLTLSKTVAPFIIFNENGTGVARVQGKDGHFIITDLNGLSNFLTVNSTTGNVGIGLSNSPVKLSVDGALQVGQKQPIYFLGGPNDPNFMIQSGEWNDGMKYKHYTSHQFITQAGVERMRIIQNGNVGIGTTTPRTKLELGDGNIIVCYQNDNHISGKSVRMIGSTLDKLTDYGAAINTLVEDAGNNKYGLQFITRQKYDIAPSAKMTISGNGNVGIGTTTPDAKLAVKGVIHTQEVKVDLAGSMMGDYVFEEDYKLPTLAEIEAYVKVHKHLPEVPSAKETEENGMNLKEMNLILLKKVEELTLHLIEMKKKEEMLLERIEAIEKGNSK